MEKALRKMQKQIAHIRSIRPEAIFPPKERYKYGVKNLKKDSVYRLEGKTYLVLETGTYTETDDAYQKTLDWTGHELKALCLDTGSHHNLEWEEDDDIEVTLTLAEIEFTDLFYDDGEPVAPDSDDMDEIAEKKWEIVYRDKNFFYEDDFAAQYVRENGKLKENVYFYEFEAKDGTQLTVEVWISQKGKEEFQVFLSKEIDPDDIEAVAAA